jgi:hypothetical protein
MKSSLVQSIRENKKNQKDLILNHFLTHRFTHQDRLLIAKLMKQEYKEGFTNCYKMLKNNNH